MFLIKDFFVIIGDLISKGDKYYGSILKFSHFINFLYVAIFSYSGIHILKDAVISGFNTFIQIIVCCLLLFKFHPFKKHELKQSDSALIFACAVFLFFNLSIIKMLDKYTEKIGINTELVRSTAEVIADAEE